MNKAIETAINKQINAELESAYLYLGMAAFLESENWKGMASWMKSQSKEEITHAMKIYDYVYDRGGKVMLHTLPAPKQTWKDPLDVFTAAYNHELAITAMIHNLVRLSDTHKDLATHEMLHWFIKEQVEEEAQVNEIVQKLKMIKGSPGGIMWLDKDLSKRE